jgi:AcrR family transcriptional regulator
MTSSTRPWTKTRARARKALLDAAFATLAHRPWSAVRMASVAAKAGVSRQTLYNEFGGKSGLARALLLREADAYLTGVDRALAGHGDAIERLTAIAEWTVSSTQANALVRAMLTGYWSEQLPSPTLSAVSSSSAASAQRCVDDPLPTPADFVVLVRDRAVAVLSTSDTVELALSCELVVRTALSCVTAPPDAGGVGDLVRNTLQRQPIQCADRAHRDRGEPDTERECSQQAAAQSASIRPANTERLKNAECDL